MLHINKRDLINVIKNISSNLEDNGVFYMSFKYGKGEYIDEKNDNKTALIASTNQKIYFLKENLKEKYKKYMDKGRQIQNVFLKDELMSIGIHNNERSVKWWRCLNGFVNLNVLQR